MKKVIFYSWQSDLPNSTNRGFIEDALDKAVEAINDDASIEVDPVIERDTKGIAGSPDIAKAILGKIDEAAIFIADVSIINGENKERPVSNPNVLIELGYAAKTLGWERIVLVMNKSFGGPELLPFDLKMRRTIVYTVTKDEKDRGVKKKSLAQDLEKQIRSIFDSMPVSAAPATEEPHKKTIKAIEGQAPVRIREARAYMRFLCESIMKFYPGGYTGPEYDEVLAQSLEGTVELTAGFSAVVEAASLYDDEQVLKELFQGFKIILEHYHLPIGFSGGYSSADFDFYKFIGDELFTTMVSILLREQKWKLIGELLNYRIFLNNARGNQGASVDFGFIGYFPLESFRVRDQRLRRLSARADLLSKRHSESPINQLSPLADYLSADFFLFLKSRTKKDQPYDWTAWSSVYLKDLPNFLVWSESKKIAYEIATVLGFADVADFKVKTVQLSSELSKLWRNGWWDNPINNKAVEPIGQYQ